MKVDDRETPMAKPDRSIDEQPLSIGASMHKGVCHPANKIAVDGP